MLAVVGEGMASEATCARVHLRARDGVKLSCTQVGGCRECEAPILTLLLADHQATLVEMRSAGHSLTRSHLQCDTPDSST